MIPWRVISLEILPDYVLRVVFADGLSGLVDCSFVHSSASGVFFVLRDPERFAQARLANGTVTWPDGPDLASDTMHQEIQRCGFWKVE